MEIVTSRQINKGRKPGEPRFGTLAQPRQFLPMKEKDLWWRTSCVDWYERLGLEMVTANSRRLMKNYKLAEGIIDKDDYIPQDDDPEMGDLINLINTDDPTAFDLKFFPVIPPVVNTMVSEFAKRSTKVTFRTTDERGWNDMMEAKTSMVADILLSQAQQGYAQKLMSQGLDPESEEFQQAMDPEAIKSLPEVQDFFTSEQGYRDVAETWAEHQLTMDTERFRMDELEEMAFRDYLVTDREYWHFEMGPDDYKIEVLNPVFTFYQKDPSKRYISEGNMVGWFNMMSVASVIDTYGWRMTQEQMEVLENIYPVKGAIYPQAGLMNDGTFWDKNESKEWNRSQSLGMRQFNSFFDSPYGRTDAVEDMFHELEDGRSIENRWGRLRVTTVYWKSQRKIGYLTKIDDEGQIIKTIVDESYVVTCKPLYDVSLLKDKKADNLVYGEHLDWIWVNEVWGAVKIGPHRPIFWGTGDDGNVAPIYLGINQNEIAPLKFQFKGDSNPYGCKLPVEGAVFSDRSTKSVCLVDLMKPYQVMHNLCLNQVSDMLVDELGTVLLLDHNMIPQHSMGEDWGKNNYAKAYVAMKNFQIMPVDQSLSNMESGPSSFSGAQTMDLSQTQRLVTRIEIAKFAKMGAFEVIGITPERMGDVVEGQSATGTRIAVSNSHAQTEKYFINHCDHLMPRVHTMRTDLAQHYNASKPSIKLQYVTSRAERAMFEVSGQELLMRDLGVVCMTNTNSRAVVEKLQNLAVENNTAGASLFDLGRIMTADSLPEMQKALKQMEVKQQKMKQEEYAQQQKLEQMRIDAEKEDKAEERAFKKTLNDDDNSAMILAAEIKSAGMGALVDLDQNKRSDFEDSMERIQQESQYQQKMGMEQSRDQSKRMLEDKKLALKEKELISKERIADKQVQVAALNKNRFDSPKPPAKKK
jgi:hypothetical protein